MRSLKDICWMLLAMHPSHWVIISTSTACMIERRIGQSSTEHLATVIHLSTHLLELPTQVHVPVQTAKEFKIAMHTGCASLHSVMGP